MSRDYHEDEAVKKQDRIDFKLKSDRLRAIIKPIADKTWACDYDWGYLVKNLEELAGEYGGLELVPDFQRGHVWTESQQLHYIENALRGLVPEAGFSIQFNCPNWSKDGEYKNDELPLGWQCIDGLQRLTAVKRFLAGEIKPFGLTPEDLTCSEFMIKSKFRFRVSVFSFETRADLLQHYVDINAGGTPHPPEEIERVKKLREDALKKKILRPKKL